ncbi:MAG: GTP-binding protein, partial [Chloroflexota bacterium]
MHCHTTSQPAVLDLGKTIALVGHPNVGKSVLFQRLTGRYVAVSNYPGTTIEVTRGAAARLITDMIPDAVIIDTPGVITLPPVTEDEQVTARVLFREHLRAIVQVGDAKNLRRTLMLTVQLAEMELPLVLVLNMIDEAEARGLALNPSLLRDALGVPAIPTIATRGQGIKELASALQSAAVPQLHIDYPEAVEAAIEETSPKMPVAPISGRALSILWLCNDSVAAEWLRDQLDTAQYQALEARREQILKTFSEPVSSIIQQTRAAFIEQVAEASLTRSGNRWQGVAAT